MHSRAWHHHHRCCLAAAVMGCVSRWSVWMCHIAQRCVGAEPVPRALAAVVAAAAAAELVLLLVLVPVVAVEAIVSIYCCMRLQDLGGSECTTTPAMPAAAVPLHRWLLRWQSSGNCEARASACGLLACAVVLQHARQRVLPALTRPSLLPIFLHMHTHTHTTATPYSTAAHHLIMQHTAVTPTSPAPRTAALRPALLRCAWSNPHCAQSWLSAASMQMRSSLR